MSTLPPEILDLIADHLHDEPITLKTCCIVSKSWVPRARKHLFARVEFYASESHMERWKKTFPDPSNSPAHHTRELFIYGALAITAADAGVSGRIRTFHNVVHLKLANLDRVSLVPFHALSPVVRSLHLTYFTPDVFDLVCSFPLLEDLALHILYPEGQTAEWNPPSSSPKLTGSLRLGIYGRAHPVIRRLLDLPYGLHFSKINVMFYDKETESVADLVSRCSDTLESLDIVNSPSNIPRVVSLGLSKATKLKHLGFVQTRMRSTVQWILMTLQTVKSENLQSISVVYDGCPETIEEEFHQEWQNLDRLLVQFWVTHSIRPRVTYKVRKGGEDLKDDVSSWLPELTGRGIVDLTRTSS